MNTITFATGFIGAVLATEILLKPGEASPHANSEMDQSLYSSRDAVKVYGKLNSPINNGTTNFKNHLL